MGMFRDREAELSGLRLLVERVKEPARRAEFTAEEWSLAMVGYALSQCEDAALFTEGLELYDEFSRCASQAQRRAAIAQLARFVGSRRGEGWRALLLCAMGEVEDESLSMQAAAAAMTLAPRPSETEFCGVRAVVRLLAEPGAPPALLSALLSLSDLRLLPSAEQLCSDMPASRLTQLLCGLSGTLNSLSSAWILCALERHPALAEPAVAALMRLAAGTPLVADIVMPLPSWQYEQPAPQPLHAWSLQEFFPRMRPRLEPFLSAEQMQRLRAACA